MPKPDNIYDELAWRGLIFQESGQGQLKEYLSKNKVSLYCGFDPTGDSLHIGSLVPLITLRRFQEYGHTALPLAGGATGMIGDPSGKSAERNLLTEDDVRHNVDCIKEQLKHIVDFENGTGELVNNYDWISKINIIEYLRDIGKNFSVNVMMQKDSVKSRLQGAEAGISYTEFSYMILQGYDFLHLNREKNCTLQIGGSDQWGNMTAGMDLIRRCTDSHGYCLTVPLITKSDGSKFGKTASGAIWLDSKKTCPYEFYQYWINTPDADVINFLKYFTFLTQEEIEGLEKEMNEAPHLRSAQKKLAFEMTSMLHGETEAQKAIDASAALFGKDGDITIVDEATIESLHQTTDGTAYKSLDDVAGLLQILQDNKLATSGREARQFIKSNAVSLNNKKISDEAFKPSAEDLLHGKYLVLKRGKKGFSVVKFG
ncbi:MAG: tyrosine--tRNA ligase [Lentisphaeraceae bacterium]|nr:tyrosine--tRNA ligase [Lentisphaeraceae bacterium]